MAKIKVMGHCPPDTDSTCSPIVYSWFLNKYKGLDTEAVVSGKLNKEAQFVLNHFGVTAPQNIESVGADDQLVLIDTNNPEELITGWDQATIIELVDHHKLYGLKSDNIPSVTIRPYGCVATVLWELMSAAHNEMPKEMVGLLLSCILSDTLKLTSPTTTEVDREAVSTLSSVAGLDVDQFASEMFAAKSNLDGMSIRDILLTDAKNFDFGGKGYKLAVLETTNPEQALGKRAELEAEMKSLKEEEKLTGMVFFVVDILNSNAVALTSTEEENALVEKAFSVTKSEDGTIALPGIVSRKKQIVPAIEKFLSE